MADPGPKNWHDTAASLQPDYWSFAGRARVAAALLSGDCWICDIGCGQQQLKWFLRRDAIYLPADLARRTPDTELCELNLLRLPDRSLSLCDIAVMLGVISHLREPRSVLETLSTKVEYVIVSFSEPAAFAHLSYKKNAYDLSNFLQLLNDARFEMTDQRRYGNHEHIVKAKSLTFGDPARSQRRMARGAYQVRRPSVSDDLQRLYHQLRVRRFTWKLRPVN
jgi:hypothetical protein